MISPFNLRLFVFITIIVTFLLPVNSTQASSNLDVVPIKWGSFDKGNPTDKNSRRIKQILLNTNKYGLTTWWDIQKKFNQQTGTYLNFGGTLEHEIRHPAAMSLGLATSLAFNIYEPLTTKVSKTEATDKTVKLISSLAYNHKANMNGGWGDHWQSAHWAHFAGFAGWLMWDDLSNIDREYVRQMVEHEANRLNNYSVPYWKKTDGTDNYPGDTKAEENAWNAQILQLATAMMPNHHNWNIWMNKNVELMISSAAVPSDKNNKSVLNGKAVKDWINGSNINEDGTVINHGFTHPDYMEFIAFNNTSALQYTLANMATPEAAFYHSDLVYKSFVELEFNSPPSVLPGGTIYREGSPEIYYPEGNDWGTERRMQFAMLDIFANVFQYDQSLTKGGDYWEPYHAQQVLDMQNRHSDGHTYDEKNEDTYRGREEWVAHHAAWAWIAKWVDHSEKFETTNQSFIPSYKRLSGSGRYETAAAISKEGWAQADTVFITRGDTFPDALAGAPLAYQFNAPILLTEKEKLPNATKIEIQRLKPKRIVILGGDSAVIKTVEDSIRKLNINKVERIAGDNRYETARKIAEQMNIKNDTAFIVYGNNFPDALAAAAIAAKKGYPILLTDTKELSYDSYQIVKDMSKAYVIGGDSVISDSIVESIPNGERIDGNHRYETAANLIKKMKLDPKLIFIVNGETFPDALSGSVLAAQQNANLLLVEPNKVPFDTNEIFNEYDIESFTVLGGNTAVNQQVVQKLMKD